VCLENGREFLKCGHFCSIATDNFLTTPFNEVIRNETRAKYLSLLLFLAPCNIKYHLSRY